MFASLLLVFGTGLGFITAGDNVLDFDWRISQWVQRWQGDIPSILYRIGDISGDTVVAVAMVVGLIITAAIMRSPRFVAFFVAVGLFRLLGMVLKPLFDSPRPSDLVPLQPEVRIHIFETMESTGYPSGHSMTAAMFATILVIVTWTSISQRTPRGIAAAVAIAFMIFVGWSRVWGGAHWPTDVLGGWSYGVALVLFAWVITSPFAASDTAPATE